MNPASSTTTRNFYPRPPRGGRLNVTGLSFALHLFLSTPSARRATAERGRFFLVYHISIHALREEGDRGARPFFLVYHISIHALREEGDGRKRGKRRSANNISIHALREEGDLCSCHRFLHRLISIHALREEGDWF